MIALIEAKRAGLLMRKHWMRNIVAGAVVGVVALPLAMAFAIASGAKPEQGIYTAIVAGLVVSICGGSRVQIAGPTGAFVVILAGVTAEHGIAGLQIATMFAGLILVLLGTARLGAVIKFIPDPVIVGFTAGIAVIIWTGEWKDFFGLQGVVGLHFHEKLFSALRAVANLNVPTTALGALTLAIVVVTPRIPGLKRLPGPVVGLTVATALTGVLQPDGVATIGSVFGGFPHGLPTFQLPDFAAAHPIELIGPAFTIAMLGAIESLLSAVVADGMSGTRHNSNQELIGQGLANVVAPLFGGFAATGAIARTATNIRSGGNAPIAGIVHALTLVTVIVSLAPLAVYIPLTALAAILFVVAWNMSEARHFVKIVARAPAADVIILLVTFALTVFVDLVVAVNVGVIVAMLHFLRRMASSVEIHEQSTNELNQEAAHHGITLPPGVLVYAVEGPFFFGAAETFERALASTHTDPKVLIIRLKWVPFMDITGLQTLEEVIIDLHRRKVRVMVTGANTRVHEKLRRAGVLELIGPDNHFDTLADAVEAAAEPAVHSGVAVPRAGNPAI